MKRNSFINGLLLFFWIFVVIPKELFMGITLFFLILVLIRNPILVNNQIIKIVFLIVAVHLLAIFLFYMKYEPNIGRTIAAINTAASWGIAGIVYTVLYSGRGKGLSINKKRYEEYLMLNISILILFTIISITLMKNGYNVTFIGRNFLFKEWSNSGVSYRVSFFMEYCALVTCFILINLGLLLRNKINGFRVALMFAGIIPVLFTRSRICILAYSIFCAVILISYLKKHTKYFKMIAICISLFCFLVMLLSLQRIQNYLYDFIYARNNSTTLRFRIYTLSLDTMWNTNPLIGCGIKTTYIDGVPLGSHSTYIGILYKTGIVGGILVLMLFKHIYNILKKVNNPVDWAVLIAMAVIMAMEDIDGTNWLIFYVFFYLGLMSLIKPKDKRTDNGYRYDAMI